MIIEAKVDDAKESEEIQFEGLQWDMSSKPTTKFKEHVVDNAMKLVHARTLIGYFLNPPTRNCTQKMG